MRKIENSSAESIIRADVVSVRELNESILEVVLELAHYISYDAGQYLKVHIGTGFSCYSIANAPSGLIEKSQSGKYVLHFKLCFDNSENYQLLQEIQEKRALSVSLPYGSCHLNVFATDKPLLFIAAGIGFAPIKAMIETLILVKKQKFELFWGARVRRDLYMDDLVKSWQRKHLDFHYEAILSTVTRESLVSRIASFHHQDLKDWQFVIAGPFDMAYATRDALLRLGVPLEQLFSDAFSFETGEL